MNTNAIAASFNNQMAMGLLIEKTLGQAAAIVQDQAAAAIKLNLEAELKADQQATIEGVGEMLDVTA